jgi:hypothetical protein
MAATIMQTRELPRQTDEELLDTHHHEGNLASRHELIGRFMPFARKLAVRHMHRREPMDDLMQVASIGLLNAIDSSIQSTARNSRRLPRRRSSASSRATFATRGGRSTCRAISRSECWRQAVTPSG